MRYLDPDRSKAGTSKRWFVPAVGAGAVLTLALGFVLGSVTRTPDEPKSDRRLVEPAATARANPLAAKADFIITDTLLAHPPTFSELRKDVTETGACQAGSLRVANASRNTVGLVYAPDESDVRVELGIVQPAGVFIFETAETGAFYILEAEHNAPMFRFQVAKCAPKSQECCPSGGGK